jgi:recombination protein RecT
MGEQIVPKEQAQEEHPRARLLKMVEGQSAAIVKSLPKHLTPERMLRVSQTAISKTPALWDCAPDTIISSLVEASQMGLEPNGPLGEAALVPFKNKRTRRLECQLMVMYRGYIELADRTDRVAYMDAQIVYDCDDFLFRYGMNQTLDHTPALVRPKDAKPIAGYAFVQYKEGAFKFVVLSYDEIEEVRQCSRAKDGDAWKKWWGEMAKKTCLRRLVKYVSLSPELTRAAYLDDSLDGGVRPEDAASQPGAYDTGTADALKRRLSGAGSAPTPEEPPTIDGEYTVEGQEVPPPCDADGVVQDAEVQQEAEAEAAAQEEPPPKQPHPADPVVFGTESVFFQKVLELRQEFGGLAEGHGLSKEEATEKWRAKVMQLLGSEGVSMMGELDQKGKNQIIKGLAAAVKDYRAALDARES